MVRQRNEIHTVYNLKATALARPDEKKIYDNSKLSFFWLAYKCICRKIVGNKNGKAKCGLKIFILSNGESLKVFT